MKQKTDLPATEVDRDRLVREIARIRAFELKLLDLFSEGKLFGTTHTKNNEAKGTLLTVASGGITG